MRGWVGRSGDGGTVGKRFLLRLGENYIREEKKKKRARAGSYTSRFTIGKIKRLRLQQRTERRGRTIINKRAK